MSRTVAEQDVQSGSLVVAVHIRQVDVAVLIEIGGGHIVRIHYRRQQPRILEGLPVTACNCEAQTKNEAKGMRAQAAILDCDPQLSWPEVTAA